MATRTHLFFPERLAVRWILQGKRSEFHRHSDGRLPPEPTDGQAPLWASPEKRFVLAGYKVLDTAPEAAELTISCSLQVIEDVELLGPRHGGQVKVGIISGTFNVRGLIRRSRRVV